ncbi:CDP-6-deoxy-D-xylo-4-hexulose-3-dehydrase [Brevinema andersonii]|uniref:CDP-6-deoxy-D-xylo-4-hexulose-3-dehydrase n=1 Tax=Brevinema andersonii TaxID=34097 RepID=A0A1I1E8Q3_BREAD|nr:DegT/DnrJ/EryC1/StrS family aminotransferase [Brevinema andersonii]SFB83076.1 CDP-6-deoxy-D-xylo-4-hexulose-3-dehydrase [Brevinema andersonii]
MKYELASLTWDEAEKNAILSVLEKGMYTMGEKVSQFEQDFAAYNRSKYCVFTNSGSSANLLMIAALFYKNDNPLKIKDEVIVPAVSWPTTYYPLYQYGLKLKFVDVDIHTLNYDLNALQNAISDRTRLIMAVNLLGNPNDYETIQKMISGKNIYLIEDNCEALGAEFQGKMAGTIGLMGSYSTFFSHHMATMEGGPICTDDEELYHILLSLRAHGWTRNLPKENKLCIKSDNAFEESFRFILPGYNVRPIEMEGAVGIEQLKKLPQFIKERRKNAAYFTKIFENDDRFYIQKEIGTSSWFGFSLIIKPESGLNRLDLIKKLTEAQIESRPIVAGNFAKNEVLRFFDYEIHNKLSNANILDKYGFFIGNHQYDIREKLDYLKKLLADFL